MAGNIILVFIAGPIVYLCLSTMAIVSLSIIFINLFGVESETFKAWMIIASRVIGLLATIWVFFICNKKYKKPKNNIIKVEGSTETKNE